MSDSTLGEVWKSFFDFTLLLPKSGLPRVECPVVGSGLTSNRSTFRRPLRRALRPGSLSVVELSPGGPRVIS